MVEEDARLLATADPGLAILDSPVPDFSTSGAVEVSFHDVGQYGLWVIRCAVYHDPAPETVVKGRPVVVVVRGYGIDVYSTVEELVPARLVIAVVAQQLASVVVDFDHVQSPEGHDVVVRRPAPEWVVVDDCVAMLFEEVDRLLSLGKEVDISVSEVGEDDAFKMVVGGAFSQYEEVMGLPQSPSSPEDGELHACDDWHSFELAVGREDVVVCDCDEVVAMLLVAGGEEAWREAAVTHCAVGVEVALEEGFCAVEGCVVHTFRCYCHYRELAIWILWP